VWKVREIGFLEVMIELDRIKIEKIKVQKVVNWPVLKRVKNMQKFLGLANYYRCFVKNLMRIIRELDKKSLMYCYSIYTNGSWSMLMMNNSILKSICHS